MIMNIKKTTLTVFPLLWLFFFVADFIARTMAGATALRKLRPYAAAIRGVRSAKRLSAFILIIMNVFLLWNWIGATKNKQEP
jgi:hypothetical protein